MLSRSIIASSGCGSRFLLWEADLPPVQLERSGWFIGVCVSGRHSGVSGLHWWKQDPGHPPSAPSASHTTPTEVRSVFVYVCEYILHHVRFPLLIFAAVDNVCLNALVSRVISRAPGLKLVVETLITSLRPIGNIVLICCAFFIVFGILGVQVICNHWHFLIQDDARLKQVIISHNTSKILRSLSCVALISLPCHFLFCSLRTKPLTSVA